MVSSRQRHLMYFHLYFMKKVNIDVTKPVEYTKKLHEETRGNHWATSSLSS
jgi:hypothetical protein